MEIYRLCGDGAKWLKGKEGVEDFLFFKFISLTFNMLKKTESIAFPMIVLITIVVKKHRKIKYVGGRDFRMHQDSLYKLHPNLTPRSS